MNTKIALIILAALFAGTTIFYANRAGDLRKQIAESTPVIAPSPAPPPNLETARLRKLLEERETAYIQLETAYRQLQRGETPTQEIATAAMPVASSSTNRLSWTERVKQEDPERYKQMMAERDQRRKQMEQWYQERVSALDLRAQNAPTQQEAELATKIADNLAKLHDLGQQWSSIRDMPDAQREAAIDALRTATRETYQNLRTLGQQDRQLQLQNLAQSVGYTSTTDIQKFTSAISSIYQTTDYTPRGGGMGGGSGDGRRRDN